MVVKEPGSLPAHQPESALHLNWASLPQRCFEDLELSPTTKTQHIYRLFMGQQEPRLCSERLCPEAARMEQRPQEPQQSDKDSEESSPNEDSLVVSCDRNCCGVKLAHTDEDTRTVSTMLTEAEEDSSSLMTDSDLHFPPILDSRPVEGGGGGGGPFSPSLPRTFAQVLTQDPTSSVGSTMDSYQTVCSVEDTENTVQIEDVSDDSSPDESDTTAATTATTAATATTTTTEYVDKTDDRYQCHLQFATKCGYSESDLEKVLDKRGLDCDKNLLLQELIGQCSQSRLLGEESPAQDTDADPEDKSPADRRGAESPPVLDGEQSDDDVVEEVGEKEKVEKEGDDHSNLRPIVIDGSNVAMSHGKSVFSCRGIQLAVDWFRQRGHRDITVFVPQWRKETPRPDSPITDQALLLKLEQEGVVVFTPARRVRGRRVVCYDDRYVLTLAAENGGVVVSNDNYRDLLKENDLFRSVVDERLLMYTFVNDRFMPPEDPLGRRGPTLDNFLRMKPLTGHPTQPLCPYGRKCTFGPKCKYHHPERGVQSHKMVSEVLKEQASRKMQERRERDLEPKEVSPGKSRLTRTRSLVHSGDSVSLAGTAASVSHAATTQVLQEPAVSTDGDRRVASPPQGAGKTSDYLREHRQKLERELAMAGCSMSSGDTAASYRARDWSFAGQQQTGSDGFPAFNPHLQSSPLSPLGSPATSEGQLVSGHLLLAKKLSDEASSDSRFFSRETVGTTPQRSAGSPPPCKISQSTFPSNHRDRYRRPSLSDYRQHHHQHHQNQRGPFLPRQYSNAALKSYTSETASPNALPSFPYDDMKVPGPESLTVNCPTSERVSQGVQYPGQHSIHEAVTNSSCTEQMPLTVQSSNACNEFMSPSATRPADRPIASGCGGTDLHNGFPDPWYHMSWASAGPRCPPCLPSTHQSSVDTVPPVHTSPERGVPTSSERGVHTSSEHWVRTPSEHGGVHTPSERGSPHTTNQQYSHDLWQAGNVCTAQPPPPPPPQTNQSGFFSREVPASSTGAPQWGGGGQPPHPNTHPFPPFPYPHSPHRLPPSSRPPPPPPPPMFQTVLGSGTPSWHRNSPPPPGHPAPPPAPPCGQSSGQSIAVTDPRYPVYLHLCDTFAQHRVQAVMTRYPQVTDLHQLCAYILSEL